MTKQEIINKHLIYLESLNKFEFMCYVYLSRNPSNWKEMILNNRLKNMLPMRKFTTIEDKELFMAFLKAFLDNQVEDEEYEIAANLRDLIIEIDNRDGNNINN